MDSVAYALGQTDELKGTGVFSGIQLKREKPEDDEETVEASAADKKKKKPEKTTRKSM